MRVLLSTGSPLAPEGFDYVYAHIKRDINLASMSGGTDISATISNGGAVLVTSGGKDSGTTILKGGTEIVAAGETRTDETVRFAVEDLLTAGAVIDALGKIGIDACSPEAAAACAAYTGLERGIRHMFTASVSGGELLKDAQGDDIAVAYQTDVSTAVPVLVDGVFTDASPAAVAARVAS